MRRTRAAIDQMLKRNELRDGQRAIGIDRRGKGRLHSTVVIAAGDGLAVRRQRQADRMVANRCLQRGDAATHNRQSIGRRVGRCCTICTKGRCCRHNCRSRSLADACNAKAYRRTGGGFIQCDRAVARSIGENRTIICKTDICANVHCFAVAGGIAITIGDRRRRGQRDRAV